MQAIYEPCPCGSGTKFKFCCLRKSPQELLENSDKFPVNECLFSGEQGRRSGLTTVFVSRQVVDGRYIIGTYMLDIYCLGVKDTFFKINIERGELIVLKRRLRAKMDLDELSYEDARSLILGAVDYASKLGFEPQKDWRESRFIVESDRAYLPKFEFGYDGKPFYVPGPFDDSAAILRKLAVAQQQQLQSVGAPEQLLAVLA